MNFGFRGPACACTCESHTKVCLSRAAGRVLEARRVAGEQEQRRDRVVGGVHAGAAHGAPKFDESHLGSRGGT
jgi:hypothetical protein